jgi:tetratricopeptide (TPR) repeat protein
MLTELDSIPMRDLAILARHIPFLVAGREPAVRLLHHIAQPPRPREIRALAHILLAHTEAGAGRLRAAERELEKAAAFDPTRALEHRAIVRTLPFVAEQPDAERQLREALRAWRAKEEVPSWIFPADHELHGVFRDYLNGLLSARAGDFRSAANFAVQLGNVTLVEDAAVLARNLSAGVRALVATRRRDYSDALVQLERTKFERGAADLMGTIPFFSLPHERFLRAQALEKLGRDEEALGWYGSFREHSPFSRAFRAPADLRRATIYERLGKPEQALPLYRAFVAAWRNCDRELAPLVDHANSRISALR